MRSGSSKIGNRRREGRENQQSPESAPTMSVCMMALRKKKKTRGATNAKKIGTEKSEEEGRSPLGSA